MAGQLWAVNSLGGFMYSLNLSDELRNAVQPLQRFRQFCDADDAGGKNVGQTWTWDTVQNVATAGGTLTETSTMPETNFTILQGTLTVTEYGNSVPYSGLLENLSKFAVRRPVMQALRNDNSKVMDRGAWNQFNATPLRVVPTGGTSTNAVTLTTNGTATLTNNVAYGNNHHKAVVDLMKERNIPAYSGDDYMAIAWPSTLRTFKNNLESIHQYTPEGIRLIFNGEIGRYENIRYTEQTNVAKGGAADVSGFTGITNNAWDQGFSDWIFFFGEDTVMEGVVVPDEMRAKIPGDYGRSKGVAWYSITGFGIVHTNADQARIVKWDSAS